jgi:hypothetical protein
MELSNIKLPSNKKFGYFFTFIFGLSAVYFYSKELISWSYIMLLASAVFLFIAFAKADILLPLNKLWMSFGLILSMIVSPLFLGAIFFGIFTPIALVMRLSGRDELRLKFYKKPSHWIVCRETIKSDSFKHQF